MRYSAPSRRIPGRTNSQASVAGLAGEVHVVVTCDHVDNRNGLRFGGPYAGLPHE